MDVEALVREYLPQVAIMQLATSVNDQPWACTVHYYSDDALNLYWVSTEVREHSQMIAQNPRVSAAIVVHENTSEEKYIVGISLIGEAELIGQKIDDAIGSGYIKKTGRNPQLLDEIAMGKNPHKFYRLKPSKIVLFDTLHFTDKPRQELALNA
jgi:uncharacterized protein YhbP (UPF0306 family)